jgi:hypothetical protein
MNITFWFIETLPKMNTIIFGENGASSRLTQLTVKGLQFVQETRPARSAQHLPISCGASARTLISSTNC